MGKLRVLSGEEVCRILEANGFRQARHRGSHRILQKQSAIGSITVPVPMHSTIRPGTLLSIIRQSGLAKPLFEQNS